MPTPDQLQQLVREARALFERIDSPAELEQAKARYLGKAGAVIELLASLRALPPEHKRELGGRIPRANTARDAPAR